MADWGTDGLTASPISATTLLGNPLQVTRPLWFRELYVAFTTPFCGYDSCQAVILLI